ncbi:unnamed protein product, partial [Lymnaea stagnalis]
CQKNPGHSQFIPIKHFSELHIPDIYQQIHRTVNAEKFKVKDDLIPFKEFRNLLYHFVMVMASLTVNVQISFTSLDRPDTVPNDPTTPYSGNELRGQRKTRTASGFIFSSSLVDEGQSKACPECPSSPGRVHAVFFMQTATHNLFDAEELKHSKCLLDYDEESDRSKLKSIEPVEIVMKDIENDVCIVKCVTDDETLCKVLRERLKSYHRLRETIYQILKAKKVVYVRDYVTSFWSIVDLVFVVGHPHGKPKMVSVGHRIKRLGQGSVSSKSSYLYDTCTCPGSSGGPVYIIGAPNEFIQHSHSGALDEGNFCGDGVWEQKVQGG